MELFFVLVDPNSGEQGTYNRLATAIEYTVNDFTQVWAFGTPQDPTIRARQVIDDVPGPWVLPVNGRYTFPTVGIANAHHKCYPETELPGVTVCGYNLLVNSGRLPLASQEQWVFQRRVPGEYALAPIAPRQVTVPD